MAYLFGRYGENVLESINAGDEFPDQFEGGFFDYADSNFLGIAIGKKAKARKAAKRNDRQAKQKYKLETERIRALQGQPRENIVKNIAQGLSTVAGSIFGGGAVTSTDPESPYYPEQQPGNQQPNDRPDDEPKEPKNNTMLYVIIGVVVVGAIYFLKK